jgi:predicted alpha/beta-fold hydrolase
MGDIVSRNVYARSLGANLVNLVRVNEAPMRSFEDRDCAKHVEELYKFKSPKLEDFDNLMTCYHGGSLKPHGVFPLKNATEYYLWASTHKLVADVRVPLLAINAADDPVVQKVPMDAGGNPWATIVLTSSGGHLGWFEAAGSPGRVKRWVSKPVLEWLSACGRDLASERNRSRALCQVDGFLKEVGDDRAHLGCQELDAAGIVVGTVGNKGFLSGL